MCASKLAPTAQAVPFPRFFDLDVDSDVAYRLPESRKKITMQKFLREVADILLALPSRWSSLTSIGRSLSEPTREWLRRGGLNLRNALATYGNDFYVDTFDVVYLHAQNKRNFSAAPQRQMSDYKLLPAGPVSPGLVSLGLVTL
eukprot:TRINITY_DN11149_c0_g1_i3.p1 TRINITY_DN11149_c0_g1~~TRINITY_DN11149_c0_g1_i3.p1  ORF type:complete len:144 (-),score=23.87 TRINITY_DN11149_c0_g1_i3:42-473(-)